MASDVANFAIGTGADCLLKAVFLLILRECLKLGVSNDFLVVIEEEIDQLFRESDVVSLHNWESLENAGTKIPLGTGFAVVFKVHL